VFECDQYGDSEEIFIITVDGTGLQRLTDNTCEDGWPDWRPGG